MSTRQFIGARYVPKFFDWNGSAEWRTGVAYEALTIVTRNGNSYTSKIPVPSNIGAPESNPEYWVSTGIFNEQIERIRQLAENTSSKLDDFMEDGAIGSDNIADGAVTSDKISDNAVIDTKIANDSVTTDKIADDNVTTSKLADNSVNSSKIANDAVTTEKIPDDAITIDKIAPRYVVIVGDSYQGGYEPGGHNQGWGAYLLSMFGYNGHNIPGVGGAGFSKGASSPLDFATILSNNPPTDIDYDKVTDIVVGGGYNDFGATSAAIDDGISRFYTHCRSRYPNARIWVAPVGWTWTNNGDHVTAAMVGGTLKSYVRSCRNRKINVVNSCIGVLLGCNGISADYVHPTETGNKAIASAINAAFNGLPYLSEGGYYDLPLTGTGWSGRIGFLVSTINGIANVRAWAIGVAYNGTEITLDDVPVTFAGHPLMFSFACLIAGMGQFNGRYANAAITLSGISNSNCYLGMQMINSDGTAYLKSSNFTLIGTNHYVCSFSADLTNG